jgi:hypothetical protein
LYHSFINFQNQQNTNACIAFCPDLFAECPSLMKAQVEVAQSNTIDFSNKSAIPDYWLQLREEARAVFGKLKICTAKFVDFQIYTNSDSMARI